MKYRDIIKNNKYYNLLIDHFNKININDIADILNFEIDYLNVDLNSDIFNITKNGCLTSIGEEVDNKFISLQNSYLEKDKVYNIYYKFRLTIKMKKRKDRILGFKDFGRFAKITNDTYSSLINFQKRIKKVYNLDVIIDDYQSKTDEDENLLMYSILIKGMEISQSEIIDFFNSISLNVEIKWDKNKRETYGFW